MLSGIYAVENRNYMLRDSLITSLLNVSLSVGGYNKLLARTILV